VTDWTIHGRRTVYASPWLDVDLVDIEAPDGHRVPEHHAIRVPFGAVGCVVLDASGDHVLLMWRHRFISGGTGWEIPAGRMEAGEAAADTAARETLEETGYAVRDLVPLATWHPSSGLSNQTFHAFLATGSERVAEPVDTHEAERIEFVPIADVIRALDDGEISDGLSLVALHTFLRRRDRDGQGRVGDHGEV
jgi:8-oxo-dGTP pyrophosphatase MutT (NUDIX family)